MIQLNQVQERMSRIEQCVDDAALACRSTGAAAPEELRNSVVELDRRSDEATKLVQQSTDEDRIRECVDDLEQIGDRAMQACRNAGSSVDPQLKQAVQRAHDEISGLKKQLH